MIPPPEALDGAMVRHYALLNERHQKTERYRHFVDGELLTSVAALSICQYKEGEAYLFHCTEEWKVITDDLFATIEEAMEEATAMYKGLTKADWISYR